MKKHLFVLFVIALPFLSIAQQKKEYDFMVASLNNPSFCIYDLLTVCNMNSRNTQFISEAEYRNSNFIHRRVAELCGQYNEQIFHNIYVHVSNAWAIFKEVENADLSYGGMGQYMMERSYFDTRRTQRCPYPELKNKLCLIPFSGKKDDRVKY